jgi:hypothetical protein
MATEQSWTNLYLPWQLAMTISRSFHPSVFAHIPAIGQGLMQMKAIYLNQNMFSFSPTLSW